MKQQHVKKYSFFYWSWFVAIALLSAVVLRTFVFGLYHVPTGSAEPSILVGDRIWGNKLTYTIFPIQRGDLVIFDSPEYGGYAESKLAQWWQRYIGVGLPLLGLMDGPENWIKRVIGVPGDVIEGRIEDGRTVVYLNGKQLNESYVNTYPLIRLRKKVGFYTKANALFASLLPSWLQKYEKEVDYSYDPCKPLENQPFYYIKKNEIVQNRSTHKLLLTLPFTPTYIIKNRLHSSVKCIDTFGPVAIPKGKYWVMGDSRKNSKDSRYWGLLDEGIIRGKASFVIYSIDGEEVFWFFDMLKSPVTFFTKRIRWKRFFTILSTSQHYDR